MSFSLLVIPVRPMVFVLLNARCRVLINRQSHCLIAIIMLDESIYSPFIESRAILASSTLIKVR